MVALTSGIIGIATAVTIVVLVRRDHLHVKYGMWWFAAAAGFAMLGLFPSIVDFIGVALGIAYPPVLALIVGLVIKILVMDIERSRNQIKLQRLVQRIALLEAELREQQSDASEAGPVRDRTHEPPVG